MPLTSGTRLGSYEVVAPLGAGGMGEVYRVRDTALDRDAALKVLPAKFASDPERLERFDREAKATAALNHPNIVTIYAIERHGEMVCIVMELVDGRALDAVIPKGGLPLDRFYDLAIPLADALSAAHDKGITHRDLKPANVMVSAGGRVKILDFGLAKLGEAAGAASTSNADVAALPTMAITGEGRIVGTVAYMSPEQAQGKAVDTRSDLFSLGVLLYEMLTGEQPFTGDNAMSVLSAILKDTPKSITELKSDVPPELGRLIRRCLEKDPGRRIQTARDLRNELQELKEEFAAGRRSERRGAASSATAESSATPRSSRVPLMVGAAVVLASMVALAVWRGWIPVSRSTAAGPIDSVVVLPFANASGNPDTEYLSDGMTDSVINSLAKLGKVRVVPRGVAFSYKGNTSDLPAIAKALNVRAIVTGRVAERGDTLVVGVELTDMATVSQTWGDQYTRKAADIFALQDAVARDIVKSLHLPLAGDDDARLTAKGTRDAEAYRYFLRGDFAWDQGTPAGWAAAIGLYQQAIDRDPTYAAPYTGMASSYLFLGISGAVPPSDAFAKARVAVDRALAIDEGHAKAHDILGVIKHVADWDSAGAEAEFRRGHALDPNVDDYAYASFLSFHGRDAEAIAEMQRAIAVNPGKVSNHLAYAGVLLDAGRHEDALREALPFADRAGLIGILALGDIYLSMERFADAEAVYLKARDQSGAVPPGLAVVFARTGRPAEAERAVKDAVELAGQGRYPPAFLGLMYAGLGKKDDAFRWLNRAVDERAPLLRAGRNVYFMKSLMDDPRWPDLQRRLGLQK